jgi:hypothetical protein
VVKANSGYEGKATRRSTARPSRSIEKQIRK